MWWIKRKEVSSWAVCMQFWSILDYYKTAQLHIQSSTPSWQIIKYGCQLWWYMCVAVTISVIIKSLEVTVIIKTEGQSLNDIDERSDLDFCHGIKWKESKVGIGQRIRYYCTCVYSNVSCDMLHPQMQRESSAIDCECIQTFNIMSKPPSPHCLTLSKSPTLWIFVENPLIRYIIHRVTSTHVHPTISCWSHWYATVFEQYDIFACRAASCRQFPIAFSLINVKSEVVIMVRSAN